MSMPICERCPTPLKPTQGRFCSQRCYLAAVRLPTIVCRTCARYARPIRRAQAFCSRRCAPPPPTHRRSARKAEAVLAVLEANRHAWMTASDLAIWVFGDDGERNEQCVRQLLTRLRGWGYTLRSRSATWARPSCGPTKAYRLIEAVRESAA